MVHKEKDVAFQYVNNSYIKELKQIAGLQHLSRKYH